MMSRCILVMTVAVAIFLALGASAGEDQLRPDLVRRTHRVDSAGDRVIRGGLGLATALSGGDAASTPLARTLHWRGLTGGGEGVLYRVPSGLLLAFEISPRGAVAVLVGESESWPRPETKLALRIIDEKGKAVGRELTDATGELAWNSDGSYLAFCTGHADVRSDDIESTGTWVLNVGTGELRKVSEKGRHVAWNKPEGALYVYSVPGPGVLQEEVLRYEPASNVLSKTSRKGVYFSPSGAYYYRNQSQNYGRFDLFESASDGSLLAKSRVLPQLIPQAVGWLPDEDLLLFESWYYGENPRKPEEMPHSMLYDPRSDSAVDLGDVAILGYDSTTRAVKWRGGRLEEQAVRDLIRGGTTVAPRVGR